LSERNANKRLFITSLNEMKKTANILRRLLQRVHYKNVEHYWQMKEEKTVRRGQDI